MFWSLGTSGDTPARQLEAGQQRGGAYPCVCGITDVLFGDSKMFNTRAPFTSVEQRLKLLELTSTWRDAAKLGNLSPFETMKVFV